MQEDHGLWAPCPWILLPSRKGLTEGSTLAVTPLLVELALGGCALEALLWVASSGPGDAEVTKRVVLRAESNAIRVQLRLSQVEASLLKGSGAGIAHLQARAGPGGHFCSAQFHFC